MGIFSRFVGRKAAAAATAVASVPKALKRSYLAAGRSNRLLGDWITSALSIDQTVRQNMWHVRARARELAVNNPHCRQYLSLLQVNVLGDKGMKVQPQVKQADGSFNKSANDAISAAYTKWARSASADGRLSLTQVGHLAIKTLATDGEAFIELVTAPLNKSWFSVHLLDTELIDYQYNRLRGTDANGFPVNEIRMGIEIDEYMRPVAYHVRLHLPTEAAITGEPARRIIPANRVLHLMDPERADQTRGISWFNSVAVPLHMLEKYCEAELVAARTASAKMGWLKFTDAAAMYLAQDGGESIPTEPIKYDAAPGSIETLPPGMEFQAWSPDHPTTAFEAYTKAILRQIASGLGVSYHSLTNDLENVNYSSIRSGLLIERDTYRRLQQMFVDRFYMPIYEAWMENALLAGAIDVPSRDANKYSFVEFIPRGWQWVDPLKDVNAAILAVQNGFASRHQICAQTGVDFETVLSQLSHESQRQKELGLTLGEGVDMSQITAMVQEELAKEAASNNATSD